MKIRKVGYTKYHTIKMYFRAIYNQLMFKFSKKYRYSFCDGTVKDGVEEIEFDSNSIKMTKDKNGNYIPDDNQKDYLWVIRW